MAHTDRDNDRVARRMHSKVCPNFYRWRLTERCDVCRTTPQDRPWWGFEPAWWHDECRRSERAHSRNQLQMARNGKIDWDDLTISYSRPYYW